MFGARALARARFYDDLAISLDAGLPIRTALSTVAAPGERLGAAALAVEERIAGGQGLPTALEADPATWSPFEQRVLAAGERGGRLPETLRRLARHFDLRGAAADRIGMGLLYPIGLVHGAVLGLPLYVFVTAGPEAYARAALVPLGVIYAVVIATLLFVRFVRAMPAGRRSVDGILLAIPGVGGVVRSGAVLEYATTLGGLYASGIPVVEALRSASEATRNASFSEAGARIADRVEKGALVHEAFAGEARVFPRLVIEAVRVGETSGKLDETLERVIRTAAEENDRRIRLFAAAIPKIAYLMVVIFVAYSIVQTFQATYVTALRGAMPR